MTKRPRSTPTYTKKQLMEFARTGKPFVSSVTPTRKGERKPTKKR